MCIDYTTGAMRSHFIVDELDELFAAVGLPIGLLDRVGVGRDVPL